MKIGELDWVVLGARITSMNKWWILIGKNMTHSIKQGFRVDRIFSGQSAAADKNADQNAVREVRIVDQPMTEHSRSAIHIHKN